MREEATLSATVAAPAALCFDVASAISAYPDWAADIKETETLESDDSGRPTVVRFRAAAMGRSTSYTLRYDYSQAPSGLAWSQVEGDTTRLLDGSWHFEAAEDDPSSTDVRYELTVELAMPLPGFVKRRAEARIVHTALGDFADRVEALASADV